MLYIFNFFNARCYQMLFALIFVGRKICVLKFKLAAKFVLLDKYNENEAMQK
jgi:hypothetical protein